MKCDLCGADGTHFFRVRHETRGIVYLCGACLEREKGRLRPPRKSAGCGCGCGYHPSPPDEGRGG